MDQSEARALIEGAAEFDCGPGWSLLYCPWANLAEPNVALITLNPAGVDRSTGISVEEGSAYVHQDWLGKGRGREPLQVQIQRLFQIAGSNVDHILAGCLVPFRSPSWVELPRREEALEFGRGLWRRLLGSHRPRLTFTLGGIVYDEIHDMFAADQTQSVRVDWGRVSIRVSDYDGGRLIGLPHLSRYRLFSDNERGRARSQILADILAR